MDSGLKHAGMTVNKPGPSFPHVFSGNLEVEAEFATISYLAHPEPVEGRVDFLRAHQDSSPLKNFSCIFNGERMQPSVPASALTRKMRQYSQARCRSGFSREIQGTPFRGGNIRG
jgi:hypothetical protein